MNQITFNKQLLVILLFLGLSQCVESQAQSTKKLRKELDQVIKPFIDYKVFSGTVLVAKKGEVVYEKAFGQAHKEWQIPNTTDTKYVIGSITKTITSTLILKLVEEGKFSLSDKIDQYLPSFPKEKATKISIHHLLSNTSGIPNYFRLKGWTTGEFRRVISAEEFMSEIGALDLNFEPGEQYRYSNSGFFLLGLIVERVTGLSYEQALQQYIFKPLGMNNSGVYNHRAINHKMARGYRFERFGGYRNQDYMNLSLFKAGGNIYATTGDLLKWDQALYTNVLLSEESKKMLYDPENHYCWNHQELKVEGSEKEVKAVSYDGQIEGYSSIITRFLDDQYSIIILGNTGTGYQHKQMMSDQIATVLYKGMSLKNEIPLSFYLTKQLYEGKLDEGITSYLNEKSGYDRNETLLVDFAQQLTWSGMREHGLKVYLLNAQLNEKSAQANFSLAEAYLEMGQLEKAIPYYQKVLEHYPDNQYVKNILKQADK